MKIQQIPWIDPATAFEAAAIQPYCVWLDSCALHLKSGQYSILASNPSKIISFDGATVEIRTSQGTNQISGNPFDVLSDQFKVWSRRNNRSQYNTNPPLPIAPVIGYFGYGLNRFVERVPNHSINDLALPDYWFGFYQNYFVFDLAEEHLWEIRDEESGELGSITREATHQLTSERIMSNFSRDEYCAAVHRIKDYIRKGDIYQVNLSQRFQCDIDVAAPEFYQMLRKTNPAPYSAYLDIGSTQILSSSPECFLRIQQRDVMTRPIKGTRRRGISLDEDQRIISELLCAPKDNAELLMITDLERNDLGRVCEFGSIQVNELVRAEKHASVIHLVSTVSGKLRSDVTHVECVRSCFPGGSITGAPKIRAMEIIDELEPHTRGVYTGAIGYFSVNNLSNFNIAIRTVIKQGARLSFHVGAGIVADSDPDLEYEETLAKAQGILDAINQLRKRQRPVCV